MVMVGATEVLQIILVQLLTGHEIAFEPSINWRILLEGCKHFPLSARLGRWRAFASSQASFSHAFYFSGKRFILPEMPKKPLFPAGRAGRRIAGLCNEQTRTDPDRKPENDFRVYRLVVRASNSRVLFIVSTATLEQIDDSAALP